MHRVVNKTKPPIFFTKFSKAWHTYPTQFPPIVLTILITFGFF